jgi:hypothetical protein
VIARVGQLLARATPTTAKTAAATATVRFLNMIPPSLLVERPTSIAQSSPAAIRVCAQSPSRNVIAPPYGRRSSRARQACRFANFLFARARSEIRRVTHDTTPPTHKIGATTEFCRPAPVSSLQWCCKRDYYLWQDHVVPPFLRKLLEIKRSQQMWHEETTSSTIQN